MEIFMKKFYKRAIAALLSFVLIFTMSAPIGTQAASKAKLNKTKATLYVGQSLTLKLKGAGGKKTWSSSQKKVASVTKKGKVTARKKGIATISVKADGKKYRCKVTVKNPYLNETKLELEPGEGFRLKLTGAKAATWKSSKTQVATVKNGYVRAGKSEGKTVITCKARNKKSYTCQVTVKKEETQTPDSEQPDSEQPAPEQPNPEQPNPEKPNPEQPNPEQPDPEKPNPEQPDPEKPDPGEHEHDWDAGTVTKEPDCNNAGIREYICKSCGEKKEKEIEALGHDEENAFWEVLKKATEEEEGEKQLICGRKGCGAVLKTEVIPKTEDGHEHTWDDGRVIQKADCNNAGIREYICTVCGETKVEEIPALGGFHQFGEWQTVKEATCEEGAVEERCCTVCGYIETRTDWTSSGHNYVYTVIREADFGVNGLEKGVCTVCGHEFEQEIPARTSLGYTYMQPGEEKRIDTGSLDLSQAFVSSRDAYYVEAEMDEAGHAIVLHASEATEASEGAKGVAVTLTVADEEGEETVYPMYVRVAKKHGSFFYELESDHAVIIGNTTMYDGCETGSLDVPSEIEGYPVTELADYALAGADELRLTWALEELVPNSVEMSTGIREAAVTKAVLPEGLEKIGQGQFNNRPGITELVIPSTVKEGGQLQTDTTATSIKKAVFAEGTENVLDFFKSSKALKEVMLPESVKKIGDYAFDYCTNLHLESLPEGLEEIGDCAFVNDGKLQLKSLPESLVKIGRSAFASSDITLKNLPQNVTYYGDGAFSGCSNVTVDTIYDGVTYIGDYAFDGCRLAQGSYTVPAGVTCIRGLTSVKKLELAEGFETLPENYFYGMQELREVVLPEGLRTIENGVFGSCAALRKVNLPSTLETIGDDAFKSCRALQNVDFPSDLKTIGNRAFQSSGIVLDCLPAHVEIYGEEAFANCKNVSVPEIPEGVVSIGKNAFQGCHTESSYTIPNSLTRCQSFLGVKTVRFAEGRTELQSDFFKDCSDLEKVVLPKGLTKIGSTVLDNCPLVKEIVIPHTITDRPSSYYVYSAFKGSGVEKVIFEDGWEELCGGLVNGTDIKEAVIPGTVKTIGSETFDGCKNLSKVTLPDGLETISSFAFSNCYSLKQMTFPSSIKTVGQYAWTGTKLESVDFSGEWTAIPNYMFKFCSQLRSIDIPDTVQKIGDEAFFDCGLTSVDIPGTVQVIGGSAFWGCDALEEVVISEGVNTIGMYAFASCKNLKKITVPSTLEHIGGVLFGTAFELAEFETVEFTGTWETIPAGMFQNCRNLKKIKFPDGLKVIDSYAFAGCDALEEVVIPEGVTTLGDGCFQLCKNLKRVTIPSTVQSCGSWIGAYSFSYCSLEEVTFAGEWKEIPSSLFAESEIKNVKLPDTIEVINSFAFASCGSLESIVLPDGVQKVGEHAFDGCEKLSGINLPEGLVSIGGTAFSGCKALKEITFPNSLADCGGVIGAAATGGPFEGSGLTTVHFKAGRTSIPASVCLGCKELTDVEIPSTVTEIGDYAFGYCSAMERISLPEGLTKIGQGAFTQTTALKEITIPGSVKFDMITGVMAPPFEDSGLVSVTFADGTTEVGTRCLSNCKMLTTVHMPESVKSIGDQAFMGCEKLTKLTLPGGLQSLGMWAFMDSGLTEISIPASVKSFGADNYSAFTDSNIRKVTLEEGFTSTPSKAFIGASKLEEVVLPSTLTKIGSETFKNCTSLKAFVVPDTVTAIGNQAFYGCSSLRQVTIPSQTQSIEGTLFTSGSSYPTIITPENSAAWNYANGKGYPCQALK